MSCHSYYSDGNRQENIIMIKSPENVVYCLYLDELKNVLHKNVVINGNTYKEIAPNINVFPLAMEDVMDDIERLIVRDRVRLVLKRASEFGENIYDISVYERTQDENIVAPMDIEYNAGRFAGWDNDVEKKLLAEQSLEELRQKLANL